MDYSGYKHFSIARRGRILTLMLNRPPMNPIHYELHEELSRIFYDVQVDHECDVVILTESSMEKGRLKQEINPALFKPGMTVMDVTNLPRETPFIEEGRARACKIVEPRKVYADQLATQFKAITGQDLPAGTFEEALG